LDSGESKTDISTHLRGTEIFTAVLGATRVPSVVYVLSCERPWVWVHYFNLLMFPLSSGDVIDVLVSIDGFVFFVDVFVYLLPMSLYLLTCLRYHNEVDSWNRVDVVDLGSC
jgi:hypothetical protein